MEFPPLWLCLGFHFLIVEWRSGPGTATAASQGGCKVVDGVADCRGLNLASVPSSLPPHSRMLSHYAFREQGHLRNLVLADNRLSENYKESSAALHTLLGLRRLDLSGNSLTEDMAALMLQNLSSLEVVSLARNTLMRLDDSIFEGLEHLVELDLQRNYIFEIEGGAFDGLTELRRLNLAYNNLPCIVDFSLTQLRFLNVSYNILEWFLAAREEVAFELEILDLSHNQLLFFPLLPQCGKLHTLLLQDNNMGFYRELYNTSSPQEMVAQFLLVDGNVTNITLLVACTVVFLTFKKPLLQVIKSRCHWSSIY